SLPDQPTTVVPTGAHRAPDPGPEPEPVIPPAEPVAPSFETPSSETQSYGTPSYEPPTFETPSFETPSFEATAAAATSSVAPQSEAPPSEAPSYEAPSYEAPTFETPYEAPTFGAPSSEPPSYGAPSYDAPSFGAPPSEAPSYEAPTFETTSYDGPPVTTPSAFAGSDGTGGPPDNRKVLIGYLSGVGVLLLALILAAVYGFVIRDNTPPTLASPGTSTSSATSSETSTTETTSESPTTTPGLGGEATDGEFVFSVASTDSGDTITSPIDESVVKTANGEYFVVYITVGNNGATPLTWLSVLQTLSDGTQTYSPDVDASAALTGSEITIDPGAQLQVALAFDVPVGTVPTTIQLHGDPGSTGVELPV
ncbi:MAG: Telomeric repeat-binding factor 2/Protein of unknown function, partial [Mycobacterium sp.]|nr:Telomeric repeat-binding factor 2/Protein of unknown function [Mycobacterium sp.]